jgi:hypothetical protein
MYVPVSILAFVMAFLTSRTELLIESQSCPVYNEIKKEHFVKIKGTVITAIDFDSWKRNFNKKDIICQLVMLWQSCCNFVFQ